MYMRKGGEYNICGVTHDDIVMTDFDPPPEAKLSRLEGSNRHGLTSKDLVSSLSEARQDHLSQLVAPPPSHAHQSATPHCGGNPWGSTSEASNDPWVNSGATITLDSPTAIRNEFAEFDFADAACEDEEREATQVESKLFMCCGHCFGRHSNTRAHSRPGSGRRDLRVAVKRRGGGGRRGVVGGRGGQECGEEGVSLVESDEVEQRWREEMESET